MQLGKVEAGLSGPVVIINHWRLSQQVIEVGEGMLAIAGSSLAMPLKTMCSYIYPYLFITKTRNAISGRTMAIIHPEKRTTPPVEWRGDDVILQSMITNQYFCQSL